MSGRFFAAGSRLIVAVLRNSLYAPALLRKAEAPAAPGWNPQDSPGLVTPARKRIGVTAIRSLARRPGKRSVFLECVSKMRHVQFRADWAAFQGDFPQA